MIGPVDRNYQANFLSDKLLAGTQDFFNTMAFASNEIKFLGTQISEEQQAMERGNRSIKESIEGQS